ncbi:MAG: DUF6326 family protein [Cytophagales bacterium]|nr:DUF6326 family protein [Cytophagales bacterium]
MTLAHGAANFATKKVMKQFVSTPSLLSTLWIFVLFNIVFRDLHQFLNPVAFQEMISQEIPETQVLLFGVILEIPISMVLLSKILPAQFNKWVNLIAATITALGFLSTISSADMDDLFFIAIKTITLASIVYISWNLPVHSQSKTAAK